MAYRLKLPAKARIHDVFHVVFLKKHPGEAPTEPVILPPIANGRVVLMSSKIMRAKPTKDSWELLVQWTGRSTAEATWESLEHFKESYPEFKLEDELFSQEGRSVVDSFFGKHYSRKKSPHSVSG